MVHQKGFIDRVIGDLFHPGGFNLTREMADLVGVKENMDVLNLACQEGGSALFLASTYNCKVYGVDLSTEKIKESTKRARKQRMLKKVFFKNMDAYEMTFLPETFDIAFCEQTICLFPDKTKIFRECNRVLKESGRIIFSGTVNQKIDEEIKRKFTPMTCLFSSPTLHEYKEYLENSGYKDVQVLDKSDLAQDQYKILTEKWKKLRFLSSFFLKNSVVNQKEFDDLIIYGEELIRQKTVGYGIFMGQR